MKTKLLLLTIIFSTIHSQNFFPLKEGNKWIFHSGSCDGSPMFSTNCKYDTIQTNVLKDSLLDNGIKYYKISGLNFGLYEWLRSDSNWVYVYDPFEEFGKEDLPFLKLNSEPDEEHVFNEDGYPYSQFIRKDTVEIFNEDTEVYRFLYDTGFDFAQEYTLSKKLGFVYISDTYYGAWGFDRLIGCVINGKTYGYVTGIESYQILHQQFRLHQNYPNPFNPLTKISFDIPKGEKISLKIFDITGRKIITLVDEYLNPGNHEVDFDAANFSGGVYFYKLTGERFSQTKKLVVLK